MGDRGGGYRVWAGRPVERRSFGRFRLDMEIILKRIFRNWDRGMDWIDLAQDRVRWRAVLNAVTNFGGSIKFGGFLD